MSQKYVEQIIGRLVTDEAFRLSFSQGPQTTIQALVSHGLELTVYEQQALCSVDMLALEELADRIDPSLLKSNLQKGNS